MAEFDPHRQLEVDADTGDLVARLAGRLGTSEGEIVRQALHAFEAGLDRTALNRNAPDWLVRFWREHPLPPPTGLTVDKSFYDWLSGEAGEEDW